MEMIWIWLAIVAVSLVVEFLTWDLTSIWFAAAGLVSLIMSAIEGISWVWQLVVFIVLSAVLMIFVRQICRKILLKSDVKTNADANVGKKIPLLKGISKNENGEIKLNDVIWTAKSQNDEEIAEGSEVEIIAIEGNKMIVKKVATEEKEESEIVEKEEKNNEEVVEESNKKTKKIDKKGDK